MSRRRYTSKQAVDLLFSLPTDDDDSDTDADEGSKEELDRLCADKSSSSNNDVPVDVNADVDVSASSDESDTNTDGDDEADDWGDSIRRFEKLKPLCTSSSEILASLNSSDKVVKYFDTFFTDELYELIVQESNKYNRQKQLAKGKTVGEEVLTNEDLRAWIGLLILMGIHKLPELQNYWSTDPLLGVPAVNSVMTSKKFKKIVEIIHCNDNTSNPPRGQQGHDKLHKLRPVINKINTNLSHAYKPSGTVSVDESMIAFKGRSSMKQYMPMKPVKRGYKVWCLADSATGFVYKFQIYTGRESESDGHTLGEKVVLGLCESGLDSWTVVAFDNFFTIMNDLYSKELYAVGTVRAHRKGLPDMMKKKDKLKRGEHKFQTKGNVAAIKWMDNKEVNMLTNCYNPKNVCLVKRKAKDGSTDMVDCPEAVAQYNRIMGGVDHFDQLRERYAVGRRSIKWWHRILYWLIDVCIVNAYVMYRMNHRHQQDIDQLSFRLLLARQLTSAFSGKRKKGRPVSFLARKKKVPDDVRLQMVGNHLPQQNKNFRRCRMCSTGKSEKRTRYTCTACDVPLCIKDCFQKFHGK